MTVNERKDLMIKYLHLKTQEEDWHGVCDAANDLREMEVEMKMTSVKPKEIFKEAEDSSPKRFFRWSPI